MAITCLRHTPRFAAQSPLLPPPPLKKSPPPSAPCQKAIFGEREGGDGKTCQINTERPLPSPSFPSSSSDCCLAPPWGLSRGGRRGRGRARFYKQAMGRVATASERARENKKTRMSHSAPERTLLSKLYFFERSLVFCSK